MADLLDLRSGTDPGTVLARFGPDGSLTLAGPIISRDQTTDPTQVPGSTVIYTKGGSLYAKAPDGTVVQLQTVQAAASGTVFPLAGTGLLAASFLPEQGMLTSNLGNNNPFLARTWIPAQTAITNLWAANRDAGTWDGATLGSTIGIYTDAGVFVDKIVTSDNLWTGTGWVGGALSAGPIAAAAAGRFVYIAILAKGMTVAPANQYLASANDGSGNLIWFNSGPAGSGATNRRAFYLSAAALPASFNPVSAGTATTFTPLVAVT